MSLIDLRNKYGKDNTHKLLNRAIRAEIPGGDQLLDAAEKISAALHNPSPQWAPERIHTIRKAREELAGLLDGLRDRLRAQYGISKERAQPAQPEGQTPAPATRIMPRDPDARDWRPPAAIVERMGVESDAALAAECGPGVSAHLIANYRRRLNIEPASKSRRFTPSSPTSWTAEMDALLGTQADGALGAIWGISGESVRRRRIELAIPAKRAKVEWTEGRLRVLAKEPDAVAAEKLQISLASVKTARSRYKDKITQIRSEK